MWHLSFKPDNFLSEVLLDSLVLAVGSVKIVLIFVKKNSIGDLQERIL